MLLILHRENGLGKESNILSKINTNGPVSIVPVKRNMQRLTGTNFYVIV